MAVDLGLFEFASPIGTCANWLIRQCDKAGLRLLDPSFNVYERFGGDRFKPRVSLVRHPCSWLGFVYDAVGEGLPFGEDLAMFSVMVDGPDFDVFVRNYLKHVPGEVGRVFDSYLCDTRMRVEDMPWALKELLDSFGVPERMLKRMDDSFDSRPVSNHRWNPRLRMEVMEAERKICERLDYF